MDPTTPKYKLQALLVLAVTASLLLSVMEAAASQKDFPACAVNHAPEYYCCELSPTNKIVYTKFNRPSSKTDPVHGHTYEKYYEEGWAKARQVDWAKDGHFSMYAPDTPWYNYNKPGKMCRLNDVAVDGKLVETLQCSFKPDDDRFAQNKSLAEDSEDFTVYWSSDPSPRNNNASFPLTGANCTSLMLDNGEVDEDARSMCTQESFSSTYRYKSFTEAPIVVFYVLYGLCAALLAAWIVVRRARSGRISSSLTPVKPDDGRKSLMDYRGGPETPDKSVTGVSVANRPSEVHLREVSDEVVQVGYSDSSVGKAVLWYFAAMTVILNFPIIIIILDNTGNFATEQYAGLFDAQQTIIVLFIVLWAVTCIWLGAVVCLRDRMMNYFRYPDTLASCSRVQMHKPETSEVLLEDRTGVSAFVARVENFLFPNHHSGAEETVEVHTTPDGARYVEFQHLRYTYDDNARKFIPGSIVLGDTFDKIAAETLGLSTAEHDRRVGVVGRNAIEVEMPSIYVSIVDEFFSFFYIYQLMCYYAWYFTDYVYVGLLNTVVILVTATLNIYTKRSMMASIVEMTKFSCDIRVKRDGEWTTVESADLAPGDVVSVTENTELPCDLVIVQGSTVCDESMLTGESMPVQKFPIPAHNSNTYSAEGSGKKYTLFSGTKVLASGRGEEIVAVVQATGAHTNRGQLVQSILFPMPMRFKYDEQLKAVFGALFIFGFVAAYLAMKFLIDGAGLTNQAFGFVYGMFMFSAVLNPLLPVVITIGQVNAAKRLRKQDIFCINPHRIILSGKLRVFCFDKTGTITREGLDFRGCVPMDTSTTQFLPEVEDVASNSLPTLMTYGLASCHSVGSLNGQLVGSEVEVKMFQSTQWKLVEEEGQMPVIQSSDGSDVLDVVKRFEFDHARMSMSVLVRHRASGKLYVFCKGSYEKMEQISNISSLPSDYKSTADSLARKGCYVLGISYKEMPEMSEAELNKLLVDRDAVEEGLSMLGLIMFRNELKPDSRDALLTLKRGDIRTVMITGDNAMTGCYIGRASGLVDDDAQVILGDMEIDNARGNVLVWKDVDTQQVHTMDQVKEMVKSDDSNVELAVTGKAFDHLVKMGDIHKLLLNIRIFSRMTPDGKVECVRLHMKCGAVTGMCGDGGNDCGALRLAHVGVALSDAEASLVSPFTSKQRTLQSVVDVVKEGRGALATSFASVKYLIMYGFIGIGARFVMYHNSVFISQFGFMYLDGAILVGLSYGLARGKPLKKLGSERPTSSIIGPTTMLSMIGAFIIHYLFLYGGIQHLVRQPWYCPFAPLNVNLVQWWLLQDSNLGPTLWFLICWQQMSTGLQLGIGSRFRETIWRNWFLLGYYAVLVIFMCVIFVGPPTRTSDQFRVASSTNVVGLPDIPLPDGFRWELFVIGVANTVAVVLYEWIFVQGPVRNFFRRRYHKDLLPMKL